MAFARAPSYFRVVPQVRASRFRRLRGLSGRQWYLLAEATATLSLVSVGLGLLPFRRAIRLGSVALPTERPRGDVESIVWAIKVAARRLPWRIVCIQEGLTAQRMLRRRGIDACLDYGVRTHSEGPGLAAHVWVTVGGQAVIGGEQAAGFARVAGYPDRVAGR